MISSVGHPLRPGEWWPTVASVRAVVCRQLGPIEDLVIEERESPEPSEAEIVVEVKAAGVNYVDGLMCRGGYQIKFPTPYVPGGEMAGVVKSLGPGASGFHVGDRVMALTGFGAFSEEIAIRAQSAFHVPDAVDFGQAATMIQSYATALYAYRRAGLEADETVLVLGAGGGIGLAAVDVAASMGANVIAAASSDEKLEAARRAGATQLISYETEDLKARARELSGGGIDVVVDPVGGTKSEAALRSLAKFGRLCVIGFTSGSIASVPLNQVLLSNRSIIGIDWGMWASGDPPANRELTEEILEMAASGRIRPTAPEQRPLSDAPRVMADLLDRRIVGKVAVVP